MSNLRTSRTRLVGAAATVVLAALSLTACNDGSGVNDEGSSATNSPTAGSSSTTAPSGASSSGSGSGSGSTSGSTSGSDSSSGAGSAGGTTGSGGGGAASGAEASDSAGKPVTCEGSNTKTVAAPLNRPVNHMLLTVTNTGGKTCFLYGYPAVRFGEAQAVPPVIEDSQPQAVVTLAPGESGYASVNLSATDGSGSDGHTVNSLAVYFHGPSGNESVGAGASPSLPAKGVYVDDSLKVTYWQQSMDDATAW
ncbi:DUF4232 domain-containing protein [Streptomyces cyaneochromogenes]|uniref:DUF4232 domain-containing protein n=1 Tax=Streptomyces cyaneochromogenes TaxID=2496836 RepID=A0A3Q9EUE6_9ACTN|nr:DUF4232 domain-containing protein [Streptomyces cyaneochromogenes]AZQ36205.1 DUF4232 domain-containing protein [Streptomyces cyaneochromogenes]